MSTWNSRLVDRLLGRHQEELDFVGARPPSSRRRFGLPATSTGLLTITVGFAVLILLGTALLMIPSSSVSTGSTSFYVALFTATSATCVTGLVVVDSAEYWTGLGQAIIAGLMYVGGLGIMTAGTIILLAIGRRLTLADRVMLRESAGASSLATVTSLGWRIALFATAVQLAIFLILAVRFLGSFSFGEALWQGLFLSVSSFNNAGFAILPDSSNLSSHRGDILVLGTVGLGIILGGISLPVILDVLKKRRFSRWSLDTRLVVLGTVGLSFLGVFVMILFEFSNQATLGGLSGFDKVSNILFQSVTSRTAGFSTIDFSAAHEGTSFIFMVLMFVGGAAGSAAGGVKINAMMVLAVVAFASIRGRRNPEVFKREIPSLLVSRALALMVVALVILMTLIVGLAITESSNLERGTFSFLDLLFEVVSAFGTNGLSRGVTASLTDAGQVLLVIAMYVGRLGPLTIALGLALRERRAIYRFTKERVRIG